MRRAGNAVERNVTKRTAAVIDDPTKVVLRFPLGQSPNAISGSPVVPESETGEANLRNPISVSRNHWLLTIMVTEWFSTP